jgi:galacturan 1,4-alpha-galacturonidase
MLFNVPIARAIALAVALSSSLVDAKTLKGYNGPKSCDEFRVHHPYHPPPENHRPKVYIRASKNDTDDISAEFYAGLKKANHGGTLVLPKGQKFVIGKKLDLTFLNNIEVNLEGTILVSRLRANGTL